MGKKIGLGCLGLGLVAVLAVAVFGVSAYNGLVSLDQAVQAQWAQGENVYQRRADLVPNLVETVKGAAAFEKDTFTAVTEARAKVGQINAAGIANEATQQLLARQAGAAMLPNAPTKARRRRCRILRSAAGSVGRNPQSPSSVPT